MIKEACCEGFTEGINAEALGANRIELCSNLAVGGLSPSFNEVKEALKFLNIPVFVMVRPREWNFIYTKKEKELMIQEIRNLKNIKVEGIVIGSLNNKGEIDTEFMKEVVKIAKPMNITFHKAIDEVKDYNKAIEQLIEIGIDRVLTSGKKDKAEDAIGFLKTINRLYGNDITFVAAGNITKDNLDSLNNKLDFKEYHGKSIVGYLK
ncbi:MAG: copper homeostasis protein CutC [Fusobacteriaceae bacterium]|jgi:copper homeostasis protein|nr:copper homeostasis protein CutC [Fusobacteriaceae bacterium]MBP6467587.1 copper homeostasis protein CutC [Fusobacteriaceae bacterium]MBP9597184.1 copper homeostasis protein CutC [Fusobacteriaceae bacterium]MBU9917972.1 copper homeostasis protein CutC [Fusobacteriaceae bacterium]